MPRRTFHKETPEPEIETIEAEMSVDLEAAEEPIAEVPEPVPPAPTDTLSDRDRMSLPADPEERDRSRRGIA